METITTWARKSGVKVPNCLISALYLLLHIIYGLLKFIYMINDIPRFIYRYLAELVETVWDALVGFITSRFDCISRYISMICDKLRYIYRYLAELVKTVLDALLGSNFRKAVKSKAIKFHKKIIGNDLNSHQDFLRRLGIKPQYEVLSEAQSDVIIAFVAIASRAGTDIKAALKNIPDNWPVVCVVLHHTFDPDCIVPDSRRCVSKSNVLTVDCLFHEDQGLLTCHRNTEALKLATKYLRDIKVNY